LDLPFDVLVSELVTRRDLEHSPLFQVLFVLTDVGSHAISMPGLTVEPLRLEVSTARFDLSVDVVDTPHGLLTCFEYNTDLFDTATMARMLEHYQRILERFVADPDARVSELQLISASERERATVEWNRTAQELSQDTTVSALFAAHAIATPHEVAVQAGSESLTYAELQARVSQ